MINHETLSLLATYEATVPDGYNGHTARVKLAIYKGVLYEVTEHGFFVSPCPKSMTRYSDLTPIKPTK